MLIIATKKLNLILHFSHKKECKTKFNKRGKTMYVKILELSVWCKKNYKNIDKTELYRMYNNGLNKCKHESYMCLHEPSLRAFEANKGIEPAVKFA